jgi:ComF family protein
MRKLFSDFLNLFFPKICIISDKKIPGNNSNPFVLDEILKNLDRPSRQDLYLLQNKLDSNHTYTAFVTKGKNEVNQILHFIKYKGFSKLGLFLGEYISAKIIEEYPLLQSKYDFICPVPLHRTKVRERGYNQSEFIVTGLNNILKLNYHPDIIFRSKYTKSQTTLPYPERKANIKDAFRMNPAYADKVKKKRIILVDDVVTTGSTLNEIIKVLKQSGVTNVFAITLAMAKGE